VTFYPVEDAMNLENQWGTKEHWEHRGRALTKEAKSWWFTDSNKALYHIDETVVVRPREDEE